MEKPLKVPDLDFHRTVDDICGFIRSIVEQSGAKGVVLGLSGGVDSSLTAALCVQALGKDRVLGVLMPASFTPQQDTDDARNLAEQLGIKTEFVSIQGICDAFLDSLGVDQQDERAKRRAIANVRARIRMVISYYYANAFNYLVAGTSDRSELLIGFFTKHGDGGADFLTINGLYKTQVRALARHLNIPESVAYKPSNPQLYPGQKLADELPLTYKDLDPILVGLFDLKLSPEDVSRRTNVPLKVVADVLNRYNVSEHKRSPPPKAPPK
jgi:NAD+ synthase